MEKRGPELGSGHFLLFFFDYGVYPRFLFFYSKCHAIISYALKRNEIILNCHQNMPKRRNG
jgi:hypothetical protein